jgi:hypothetical protein
MFEREIFEAVYALAITYRLSSLGFEDDPHDEDDDTAEAPSISETLKHTLETFTSKISHVGDEALLPATAEGSVH